MSPKSVADLYKPKIDEESVLQEILLRLPFAKIKIFRVRECLPTGYRMSDSGIPDLHGCVPAGFVRFDCKTALSVSYPVAQAVYIEVKAPGEMEKYSKGALPVKRMKTIDDQKAFVLDKKQAGCIAFFAESWKEVCQEFRLHGILLPGDR
jgi:hypothetical protein